MTIYFFVELTSTRLIDQRKCLDRVNNFPIDLFNSCQISYSSNHSNEEELKKKESSKDLDVLDSIDFSNWNLNKITLQWDQNILLDTIPETFATPSVVPKLTI